MNRDDMEVKLGLWLYDRGFLGLIRLASEFYFGDAEKVGKKLYKEMFVKGRKDEA